MSLGRRVAFRVRNEAERGRRLDLAFAEAAEGLDRRERSFAYELSFGVTRLRGRIEYLLLQQLNRPLGDLDPPVLETLRLGAYQLLYMDRVPDYAAVSQSVDQVRAEVGSGPTGLVNAVLRRVKRAGDGLELFPSFDSDPLAFLESWGSHPRWLLQRWLDRWAAAEVRALVEANNKRPDVYIVGLDAQPESVLSGLIDSGLGAKSVGAGTACIRLERRTIVTKALELIPDAIVQDPAANLVARYCDVPPGTKVADLCSAPGGKILAVSDQPVFALASDLSESRMLMVRDNARRTGRQLGLVVADARHPPMRHADVVLLDAPCTGTGTLSRRPDARWRLASEKIDELVALQSELLASAATLLTDGGILVYSTCTLEQEENEEVVDAFLATHPDFHIQVTDAVPEQYLDSAGRLVVTPQATGFDGAFAVRMRRAA